MALFMSAADIARASDNPGRLSHALSNIVSYQMSRDLPAALESSAQAVEAARRSGSSYWLDFARGNRLLTLWRAGRLDQARALVVELADSVRDVGMASLVPADRRAGSATRPGPTWASRSIPRSSRPTTSRRWPGGTTTGWSSLPGPGSSTSPCPWPSAPWPRC